MKNYLVTRYRETTVFDSFILIYCSCVREHGNQFHKIFVQVDLFFSFFLIKMKANFKFDFQCYFENRRTIQFYILCLNFRIETKIKTLFLILYFNLSKQTNKQTNKQTKQHFRYTDCRDIEIFVLFVGLDAKKFILARECTFSCGNMFLRYVFFVIKLVNINHIFNKFLSSVAIKKNKKFIKKLYSNISLY